MTKSATAIAHAIKIDGKIDPRTIFTSRRGAIVNWIGGYRKLSVLDSVSDADIFAYWEANKHLDNAECVLVDIVEITKEENNGNVADRVGNHAI